MHSDQVLTNDQLKQQGREPKQSWSQKLGEWIKDNHDRQPSLGAELKAMTREMIKDVRGTIHESFFGRPEGPGEPGAPLNHTQAEISQDRGVVEGYKTVLDDYASRGSVHGQSRDQERGLEH